MNHTTGKRMWQWRRNGSLSYLMLATTMLLIGATGCTAEEQPGTGQPTQSSAAPEASPQTTTSKMQIGFVLVGATSDWGWNYQHEQGRVALEKAMGDKLHVSLTESIPENADAERVMQRMATDGAKVVFSTSYGYKDFCERVAAKNPETLFMQAQAPLKAPNAATYNGAIWEASYAAGVVAAASLPNETHFGFVGAHPIPPIFWTVNAFALGAQSVNPKITVDVVYVNSWHDPAAETEAVNSLAAQGVKVVYALVDSTIAVIQAAEKKGIYCVSHHADLLQFAPKHYITGAVWNWGKLYQDVAQRVLDGKKEAQDIAGGFKEGYVGLAPFGPVVTDAAKKKSDEIVAKITSGELNVFAGPISDNKGAERVPKGKSLTVPEIVSFDWLVSGVKSAGK